MSLPLDSATSSAGPPSAAAGPSVVAARNSPIHITTSEINILIHCYLLESNLVHSAFAIAQEAKLDALAPSLKSTKIPRAELIRWLHRGLLWQHAATHVDENGLLPPCSAPFTLLAPHSCVLPPDDDELRLAPDAGAAAARTTRAPSPRPELFPPPSDPVEPVPPPLNNGKGKRKASTKSSAAGDDDTAPSASSTGTVKKEGKRARLDPSQTEASTSSASGAPNGKNKQQPALPPLPQIQRKSQKASTSTASSSGTSPSTPSVPLRPISKPTSPSISTTALPSSSSQQARNISSSSAGSSSKPKSTSPSTSTKPLPSSSSHATSSGTTSKKKKAPAPSPAPVASGSGSSSSSSSARPRPLPPPPGEDYRERLDRIDKFRGENVTTFVEHTGEVFVCKFNPNPAQEGILATGAGDATVRLWELDPPPSGSSSSGSVGGGGAWTMDSPPLICKHVPVTDRRKDITSLDFNPSATLLGSASYDGIARLWTLEGELHGVLTRHSGAIFCLKFNPKGTLLATAGADGSVVVWDAGSAKIRHAYECHLDAALDLDWYSDDILASCSVDKSIQVFKVGMSVPFRTFKGHTDEVNRLAWTPPSCAGPRLLASCSDDASVRLWSLDQAVDGGDDAALDVPGALERGCRGVLRGHEKEIYSLLFAPATSSSSRPVLATSSFDHTVRLWDVSTQSCTRVLRAHADTVFSISFSPAGRYLATAGWDAHLFVWDLTTGKPVRHHEATSGIFEVDWSRHGKVLAVCQSDKALVLVSVQDLIE